VNEAARNACQKLVHDMIYEARVGTVVFYFAKHKNQIITKEQARNKKLPRDEWLRVKNISLQYYLLIVHV
jgi:hypothetical protein